MKPFHTQIARCLLGLKKSFALCLSVLSHSALAQPLDGYPPDVFVKMSPPAHGASAGMSCAQHGMEVGMIVSRFMTAFHPQIWGALRNIPQQTYGELFWGLSDLGLTIYGIENMRGDGLLYFCHDSCSPSSPCEARLVSMDFYKGTLLGGLMSAPLWMGADKVWNLMNKKPKITNVLLATMVQVAANGTSPLLTSGHLGEWTGYPVNITHPAAHFFVNVVTTSLLLKTMEWLRKDLQKSPLDLHVLLHLPQIVDLPNTLQKRAHQVIPANGLLFSSMLNIGLITPYLAYAARHFSFKTVDQTVFDGLHFLMAIESMDDIWDVLADTSDDFLSKIGMREAIAFLPPALQGMMGMVTGMVVSTVTSQVIQKTILLGNLGMVGGYAMGMAAYEQGLWERPWGEWRTWASYITAVAKNAARGLGLKSTYSFLLKNPLDLHLAVDTISFCFQGLEWAEDALKSALGTSTDGQP